MITITGLPEVLRNIVEYQGRVLEAVVVATQMSQARIANQAKADHPYRDRSGNLTNSIQPGDIEISENGVTAFVEARMAYASFVEFGTSRAKAYPFLTPAMLAEIPRYNKNVIREVNRIRL